MNNTEQQYMEVVNACKHIFVKKNNDYGTSWRVLRPISIVDQIYIKAQRIRTIQSLGKQKIDDDVLGEWKAIINYGIIALIQEEINDAENWEIPTEQALALYDKHLMKNYELMQNKNHDYGEAWRNMSQESFADLILTKILRLKQIIANDGKTEISEGMEGNFRDIINYAVFALILS
jgi:Nucleotide modification associated domain 1